MLFSKKTNKLIAASTLMLMIGFQSLDAMARVGGGSRSSGFSSSRSYSNSSASPSRAGAGNNTGMQRNNVVNNERQNGQATQQPSQQQGQQTAQQTQQQAPQQQSTPGKFGMGTVAGAAVAGAAAGYLLNSHNNNQNYQNGSNGNGASGQFGDPNNGQANNGQPASSGFPWGSILMLLIAGFGLMWLYKRSSGFKAVGETMKEVLNPQSALPASMPLNSTSTFNTGSFNAENQAFEAEALKFFIALQEANNRGDVKFMQNYSVGEMQEALISDIQNRTSPSGSIFSRLAAKVVDMTTEANQQIASVRFTGLAGEMNSPLEPLDEVWHLVRQSGEWQLAGIEQV